VDGTGRPVTPLIGRAGGAMQRRIGRTVFDLVGRRSRRLLEIDHALCLFVHANRLRLPLVDVTGLFDCTEDVQIRLSRLPRGRWSSPIADVVALCELATRAKPRRVLEVGSFRGYTAHGIASHLEPDSSLVTVDAYDDHGEAYRGTPVEAMIDRRVGEVSSGLFSPDETGSYDLIFLDADHRYDAVKHDTEIVMPLLAPGGWFVWHDYANWGFYSGANGVPEYLLERSADIPIAQLSGTNMAVHRPVWTTLDGHKAYLDAIATTAKATGGGWLDNTRRL
jgi:hypothetical protein